MLYVGTCCAMDLYVVQPLSHSLSLSLSLSIYIYIYTHMQGVSGGTVNILGRGSMDYSE
jgi:hypothetical protein